MLRYAQWIVARRAVVLAIAAVITGVLCFGLTHLRVVIDPNKVIPQDHPYVVTSNRVEQLFGSRWTVEIALTPTHGDVFQPELVEHVRHITDRLLASPGVVKNSVLSLTAPRAKAIRGVSDGMVVEQLVGSGPVTPAVLDRLKRDLDANPVYRGTVVSKDLKTTAIAVEFKSTSSFQPIADQLHDILGPERGPDVRIDVSGVPVFLAMMERYSARMGLFFPLAVLLIALIHFEAFRTIQGLILPLVTAFLAVIWSTGFMGLSGVPMDAFNATTPILILAIAAGHAVQILKRYYEEFERSLGTTSTPREANKEAVINSTARVGPVTLVAGSVAALGFFSLMAFKISTIRTFGFFTGCGILSAIAVEMTIIPALRSLLPAPKLREQRREKELTFWDRLVDRLRTFALSERPVGIVVAFVVAALIAGFGMSRVVTTDSVKRFFFDGVPERVQDRFMNEHLAGTDVIYVLVNGGAQDSIKDPRTLAAMDALQQELGRDPDVGKTLGITDFIRRMHAAMHEDKPQFNAIPDSQNLIAQYLLLYSQSGQPDDFDMYVDGNYQNANLWVFLKTDQSARVDAIIHKIQVFGATHFPPGVSVSVGGATADSAALADVIIHNKLLNLAQIALVIFLVTALVLRSVVGGLLVLLPLAMTVLVNFGVMGLCGFPLNVTTSVISPMAVGIGADYAIYFIFRLREELRRSEPAAAFESTYRSAGKAVLFVASAISGGYGVLLFSIGFRVHFMMAVLIAVAMLTSSLSTLTLLPALMWRLRPRFVFGRAAPEAPSPSTAR